MKKTLMTILEKGMRTHVLAGLLSCLCLISNLKADPSVASNLADLQDAFEKLKNNFVQELSTIPDQPSKLEDGTIAAEAETLCGKDLKELLEKVNNQRGILKQRLAGVETSGLSENDKLELKNALAAQKKPLDALQKKIVAFKDAMDQFRQNDINSLKTLYDQFSSVQGVPAATEKLRSRIATIEAPFKPKEPESPKQTSYSPQSSAIAGAPGLKIQQSIPFTPVSAPTASPTPERSAVSKANQPWWVKSPEAAAAMKKMYGGDSGNPGTSRILEFQEALNRADQGDAYAQAVVSIYYSTGYKTSKDMVRAAKYAMMSAQQKNPLGIYRLGVMREAGEGGIPANTQEGISLKAAAFQGLNNQMVGDPYAITALGVMCFRGEGGVNRNPSEAAALYRKAADMGYAPAQYCYSACLYNGQGVQRNPQLAEQYWRLACDQQYPPALKGKPVD
jgi:TPR repeat protein